MRLVRCLLLAAAFACITIAAAAQSSVIFTNNDGTFTFDMNPADTTYNELTLGTISNGLGTAGQLTAISGLSGFGIPDQALPWPGCSPACLGTISLSTGTIASGTILTNATFNPGGSFTVTYSSLGVIFSGTFSSASWTSAGAGSNTWNFFGTIMNGTLTVNGVTETITTATTVQLTVTNTAPVLHSKKNTYTFTDSQGTTNFSLAPEPGTLALFGSGLIAVGLVTRRRLGIKA